MTDVKPVALFPMPIQPESIYIIDPGPLETFGALDRFDLLMGLGLPVVILDSVYYVMVKNRAASLVNGRINRFFTDMALDRSASWVEAIMSEPYLDSPRLWIRITPLGHDLFCYVAKYIPGTDEESLASYWNKQAGIFYTINGRRIMIDSPWYKWFCDASDGVPIEVRDNVERSMISFVDSDLKTGLDDDLLKPILILYEDHRVKVDCELSPDFCFLDTPAFLKCLQGGGRIESADALVEEASRLGRLSLYLS